MAGNDRNASSGELDFMHGRMTRRHEGCVRAILTESGLSIAPPMRGFNDLVSKNSGRKPTSTACATLVALTSRGIGLRSAQRRV